MPIVAPAVVEYPVPEAAITSVPPLVVNDLFKVSGPAELTTLVAFHIGAVMLPLTLNAAPAGLFVLMPTPPEARMRN